MNIAIIDDQEDIKYAVEKILKKDGHTCYGFSGNEDDLIDGLNVFEVELIILDKQKDTNDTNEILNPTVYIAPTGVVYVRVTNANGCYKVAKITLIVFPPTKSNVLSDVIICMDEINNVNPIYYAYSKLYVYSLQDKPFLHVDGDTYIFDKLPIDYKNSDLVCQSYEYNFSFYGKVLKQVCENLKNLPIEIYNYNSENFQAINAGIIGGKDVFFFKQLFLLVNDIFKNNEDRKSVV